MARVLQLFLSCVSGEFRGYRDQLRTNLDQPNLKVQIQEDFMAGGVPTLDKLDTYIKHCDAVIHLVGDGLGSLAKPRSLDYLRSTHPDLTRRFPALEEFLSPNTPSLSYTQWEAWLALLHEKQLLVCAPTPEAPREHNFSAQPEERDLQRRHLDRLRLHEAYPEVVFRSVDQLTWQIQKSINWSFSLQGIRLEKAVPLEQASPQGNAFADLDAVTLMVMLDDSGEASANDKRYHLTPELHPAELSDLALANQLAFEPCENVTLDLTPSDSRYIGDCLKDWLTAARSLAHAIVARGERDTPPEVVLEIFLPANLLLLDCGGVKIRSATRPRPMANTCSYVVRSLDRARDQVNARSALEDKWRAIVPGEASAGLLLVSSGPPDTLRNDPEGWESWHEDLYEHAIEPGTQACIYLPDPIADDALRQTLIDALIDACVPLVLVWPGGQRSAGLAIEERRALMDRLLGLDPQTPQTPDPSPPSPFQLLPAPLWSLSVAEVATGRKRLLSEQAGSQAILVIDVPDHWPLSLASPQPTDQLRAPR